VLSYKNGDPTLYGINYNHATTMIADMCGFCSEPRLMGWWGVAPGQQVSDTHPPHPPTHPPTRLRPTNDPPTNHHHPPTTNITHTTDTTTATTTNTTITTITIATTTHHLSVFRYRSMLTTPGEYGKQRRHTTTVPSATWLLV
jgi:hypothetical protein